VVKHHQETRRWASFRGPPLSDIEDGEDPCNITQSSGSKGSAVYGFGDRIVFERGMVWNLDWLFMGYATLAEHWLLEAFSSWMLMLNNQSTYMSHYTSPKCHAVHGTRGCEYQIPEMTAAYIVAYSLSNLICHSSS